MCDIVAAERAKVRASLEALIVCSLVLPKVQRWDDVKQPWGGWKHGNNQGNLS